MARFTSWKPYSPITPAASVASGVKKCEWYPFPALYRHASDRFWITRLRCASCTRRSGTSNDAALESLRAQKVASACLAAT
jgi:hypothetical protein